jgi:hypothetical protein
LIVQPVNPSTGQPWGKLTFDHNGLVIDGVNGSGSPFGKLIFSGNELSLIGFGDPPKVRLASDTSGNAGGGAISFNVLRPDGVQEEFFLINGTLDEEAPGSLAGQLKIFVRRRNADGDDAMRLMGVISAAYTSNGEPRVRWHPNTVHDLEQFTESGGGNPGVITALTLQTNLSGSAGDAQQEDSNWLTAQNQNLDTIIEATMPIDGSISQLRIQLRRTHNGGTAPYVYVTVDGNTVINGHRPSSTSPEIITASLSGSGTKTIRVTTSAQTGTVEIGSIRGQ